MLRLVAVAGSGLALISVSLITAFLKMDLFNKKKQKDFQKAFDNLYFNMV